MNFTVHNKECPQKLIKQAGACPAPACFVFADAKPEVPAVRLLFRLQATGELLFLLGFYAVFQPLPAGVTARKKSE
ncbi:MAG: hypothetical protein ABIJ53_02565 [Verrucomicrobiota bacterium]